MNAAALVGATASDGGFAFEVVAAFEVGVFNFSVCVAVSISICVRVSVCGLTLQLLVAVVVVVAEGLVVCLSLFLCVSICGLTMQLHRQWLWLWLRFELHFFGGNSVLANVYVCCEGSTSGFF